MNSFELNTKCAQYQTNFNQIVESLQEKSILSRVEVIQAMNFVPHFLEDQKNAQQLFLEQKERKARMDQFHELQETLENLLLLQELSSSDETYELDEADDFARRFESLADELMTKILLNKPHDMANAIVEFHPGAGGTESQDWAEMLYRMITRWAEKKDFKTQVLDYQIGEEAGIKLKTDGINRCPCFTE